MSLDLAVYSYCLCSARVRSSSFDVLATQTGAVIVPSCGFDSIPADILVYLSSRTLKDALGPEAALGLSQSFYDVAGIASGGSLATLMTEIEKVPRATQIEARSDYALSRGANLQRLNIMHAYHR